MTLADLTVEELKALQPGVRVHTTRGPGTFSSVRFGPETWAVPVAIRVCLDHYQEEAEYQGTIFSPNNVGLI